VRRGVGSVGPLPGDDTQSLPKGLPGSESNKNIGRSGSHPLSGSPMHGGSSSQLHRKGPQGQTISSPSTQSGNNAGGEDPEQTVINIEDRERGEQEGLWEGDKAESANADGASSSGTAEPTNKCDE